MYYVMYLWYIVKLLFSFCSARPLEHKAKSVKSLTRASSNKRPIRIEFIIVNKVVFLWQYEVVTFDRAVTSEAYL